MNNLLNQHQMGIGTWAWGDSILWGYGQSFSESDIRETFILALERGVKIFDTAEVYSLGKAESFLGRFIEDTQAETVIASKFMPFPWRLTRSALLTALNQSLRRLGRAYIDLYQIHFPIPPVKIKTWLEAMAEAYEVGKIKAVGVSNFSRKQMEFSFDYLSRRSVPMISNQVEYHLLDRRIERNGTLMSATERGIKIIAYSPLAKGVLSGKYSQKNPVPGLRGFQYGRLDLMRIEPLLAEMNRIAKELGKTPAQVALNWTIKKGTLPIPGAKNPRQLEQNIGSLGWELTDEAVALLDDVSQRVRMR